MSVATADGGGSVASATALAALALMLLSPGQNLLFLRLLQIPKFKSLVFTLLISSFVSSPWPQAIEFSRRLSSWNARLTDDGAIEQSSGGWFLGSDLIATCFCCGLKSAQSIQHTCPFNELVSILNEDQKQQLGLELRPSMFKPWQIRQIETLSQYLGGKIVSYVESFGFPRTLVALSVVKEFVTKNYLTEEPGRLIQQTQDLSDLWTDVSSKVNLEAVLSGFLKGEQPSYQGLNSIPTDAPRAVMRSGSNAPPDPITQDSGISAAAASETQAPQFHDESYTDKCVICRDNQLNRLILPCRHLSVCDKCLRSRSQCPVCQKYILAAVVAFLC